MNHKAQSLSIIVITHNHASTLEKALDSAQWADDLVVLDQGSTDGSIEIARRFTERVFYHPPEAKEHALQAAIARARTEWILLLEPDEWIEEMLRHELDGLLLEPLTSYQAFEIPTKLYFQDRWIKHGKAYPNYKPRLFHRSIAHQLDSHPSKRLDNALGKALDWHQVSNSMAQNASQAGYRLLEQGNLGHFKRSLFNLLLRPGFTFLNHYF